MQNVKSKLAVAALSLAPLASFAAGESFDPAPYVTSITGTIVGLLAVGAAVFGVMIAIKSTKWARRAL